MHARLGGARALLALLLAGPAVSADWDLAAVLDLEARLFAEDARWPGQSTAAAAVSLAATAELRWRSGDGRQRASVIPYLRRDTDDDERSVFDLPEFYWAYQADGYELLLGANTVFWGVTESVHLVDVINQADAAADIDGEDKLGQPMANLSIQGSRGLLAFYVMPYFRERTFPGERGRLRAPWAVDTGRTIYESADGQHHPDFALRYSHYVGNFDIGISFFDGTNREPRLLPDAERGVLVPHYDQVTQFGLDLQYTGEDWLWKFEAIARDGRSDSFVAAVGGFEYSIYQVASSNADLGVLLEYQYDGRGTGEPVTLADNDVFAALRLALNDAQDTSVLAGIVRDTKSGLTMINVEAERRLGDAYVVEVHGRLFSGGRPSDPGYPIRDDDYLGIRLSRYF